MNNRDKLKIWLLQHHLTQKDLAQLIEKTTHRPCSVRAVKSLLCPPEKNSARTCPDWVIQVLNHMDE
ncbi:TPA: hypothetical protein SMP48_002916 [Proteus mirabilis]|nr:hypothetical protein [Proteus mirabilis]